MANLANEDAHDSAVAKAELDKIKSGKTTLVPHAVVVAIAVKGVHPIRAWRVQRGLTAEQLAKKAKLTRSTISQMETRKRKGTVAAYQAIAKALGIGVENLLDE